MEYEVIERQQPHELVKEINKRAGNGWELVSVTCQPPAAYGKPPIYCAFIRCRRYGN